MRSAQNPRVTVEGRSIMSYYRANRHLSNVRSKFGSGNSPLTYGAVVGKFETGREQPIQGRNGDHLQFYLSIGDGGSYQIDVNTQSRDGSEIGVYIAEETLAPLANARPDEPFGAPSFGVDSEAALSYKAIGLTNGDFELLPYTRIEEQLTADIEAAQFVAAYGMMFDDGGANGKGLHETHFNPHAPGAPNQDGGLALYTLESATNRPKRIWYFFKFANYSIR
jgi:hypothetical protein